MIKDQGDKMNGEKKRGRFIVLEGIDGAGKTTQAELLRERLESEGRRVYRTAEPTSMPTGVELRRALGGKIKKSECEMAVMFVLDRIAHNLHETEGIEAVLSEGTDIICDRYYYSTLAYQGQSTDYRWVKAMNLCCPEIRKPDICIYLDLTPEQSLRRITRGRESVEIYENTETLTRVRNAFFKVFDDLGQSDNIAVVDAYRPEDEIAEEIFSLVNSL